MRKILYAINVAVVVAAVCASLSWKSWAQCNGIFPAKTLCGNLSGSPQPPAAFSSAGSVVGPGSSTQNDLATWANSTGTQLSDTTPQQFLGYVDPVYSFSASGTTSQTTGNGTTALPHTLTVSDSSSWQVGQGIAIPGAGAAAAELDTTVTGVGTGVISLFGSIATNVSSVAVYHDDTVAIRQAMAAGSIHLRPGNYNISCTGASNGGVLNPPAGVNVWGDGVTSTVFFNRCADSSLFLISALEPPTVSDGGILIGNFSIRKGAGVTYSDGNSYGIYLNNNAANPNWIFAHLENISMQDQCGGLHLGTGVLSSLFHNLQFIDFLQCTTEAGIFYDTVSPAGGNHFDHLTFGASSSNSTEPAIIISHSDVNVWSNITEGFFSAGVVVKNAFGPIRQIFNNVSFEGNTGCAIDFGSQASLSARDWVLNNINMDTNGTNICNYSFVQLIAPFNLSGPILNNVTQDGLANQQVSQSIQTQILIGETHSYGAVSGVITGNGTAPGIEINSGVSGYQPIFAMSGGVRNQASWELFTNYDSNSVQNTFMVWNQFVQTPTVTFPMSGNVMSFCGQFTINGSYCTVQAVDDRNGHTQLIDLIPTQTNSVANGMYVCAVPFANVPATSQAVQFYLKASACP